MPEFIRKYSGHLLLAAIVIEALLFSHLQNIAGPYITPALVLLCGFAIAYLYRLSAGSPGSVYAEQTAVRGSGQGRAIFISLSILLFGTVSVMLHTRLASIFRDAPVWMDERDSSDIIPQVKILVQRLISGQQPYMPIRFGTYELFPTYLPMQWMPFTIAERLNTDYRWIGPALLWGISLFVLARSVRSMATTADRNFLTLLVPSLPILLLLLLAEQDRYLYGITIESLVASYYLLLTLVLKKCRTLPLLIAICLCLFSRYSIILWIPLALLVVWLSGRKKKSFGITGGIILFFTLIYWLPFLRNDPLIFLKGYQYHSAAAAGEWNHTDAGSQPVHLFNGLGFAGWGFKYINAESTKEKVQLWQAIHVGAVLITLAALFLFYLKKKRRLSVGVFLQYSLKIYITVFYAFIQIPYKYLFLVPLMISAGLMISATFRTGRRLQNRVNRSQSNRT